MEPEAPKVLSLVELKALFYDHLAAKEYHETQLKLLNQEIARLAQPKNEPATS